MGAALSFLAGAPSSFVPEAAGLSSLAVLLSSLAGAGLLSCGGLWYDKLVIPVTSS